jgi:hypothetical protein
MNPRGFTTRVERIFRLQLGQMIGILPAGYQEPLPIPGVDILPTIRSKGIDLIDGALAVEIKCRNDFYGARFTLHAGQIEKYRRAYPDKELFWGFLLYGLKKRPEEIGSEREIAENLGKKIVWFLPWEWVDRYPAHNDNKTGPYKHIYKNYLPSREGYFHTFELGDWLLHAPADSSLERRIGERQT